MRDIVLFVQKTIEVTVEDIKEYGKNTGTPLRVAVLFDETKKKLYEKVPGVDIELWCNFKKPESIADAIRPYQKELLAVTCRGESSIPHFADLIPHIPYVLTPTRKSLLWGVDKIMMRKKFSAHDKSITPKFMVIDELTDETFEKVKHKLGFPVVIKPSGLAQSMLVSVNYHEEEFKKNLKLVFKNIDKTYKEQNRTTSPKMLVEQFLEGQLYSIDAYVTARGKITCCPPVFVKTGNQIGFDDFFGYLRLTPSRLKRSSIDAAELVVKKSIHALGLRNITVHAELLRTDNGWKIIEVGPRIGGYRETMYKQSYGIDHGLNDILVRIPTPIKINRKAKGFSAMLKFYAKEEGIITAIKGVRKLHTLESVLDVEKVLKKGDRAKYAKHGGACVINIMLFNKDRSLLFADIRRIEQTLDIQTKK